MSMMLHMTSPSPNASSDEESATKKKLPSPGEERAPLVSPTTAKRKVDTVSSTKRYFNFISSSTVRSTTQTEAIGRIAKKQQRPTVADTNSTLNDNDDEGTDVIPPEVLRPFALLLLSQFILFVGVGAVIPTIPLYGQSIGLSGASNGIVISAPAVALLLISRNAGESADRRRRGVMMGGMALIAVSDAGTALSNDLASLVLARLGLGFGRGYAEAGERGMLADLANMAPKLRGRAMALQQACVALGIAIGAPLGGVVVEAYGARSAFLCVSAAAAFALAIYSILPETIAVPEKEEEEGGDNVGSSSASGAVPDDANSASNATAAAEGADWTNLLRTSSTWRSLSMAQSGTSFGYACKIAVIPILANEYLGGGGATGAGLLLSAAGLAGLVGAPLGGVLSDAVGPRVAAAAAGAVSGSSLAMVPIGLSLNKATMDSSLPFTTDGSVVPSIVLDGGLLSSPSSSSYWHSVLAGLGGPDAAAFALLVILLSVGASAQGPALTALGQENAPRGSEATALGLPRAVGDGTYIVAPLILGYFSDTLGDAVPGIACTVAGGAIFLGSIALLLVASSEDELDSEE